MRAAGLSIKLRDLSHEVRNCSSALSMTAAGLKSGVDLRSPRLLRIMERCAKQLVDVSRALDVIAAAPAKPVVRRRRAVKGSV